MIGLPQSLRCYGMAVAFVATVPETGLAAGESDSEGAPTKFESDPQSSPPSQVRAAGSGPQSMEAVMVTGSRFTRAEEQSAQEVLTYDRGRIERSGQSTVADILSPVPQVSINSVESTFGATSVRLRKRTDR